MRDRKVRFLWIIVSIAAVYSALMVGSASLLETAVKYREIELYYYCVIKHISFIVIGLSFAFLISRCNLSVLQKYPYIFLTITLILGVAPIISGVLHKHFLIPELNPPFRWLLYSKRGCNLQPSELAKFTLVIYLAAVLSSSKMRHSVEYSWRFIYPLAWSLIYVILLLIQRHLGAIFLIFSTILVLLSLAGVPFRKIFIMLIVVGIILLLSLRLYPYQFQRLKDWYNNKSYSSATTYHQSHARYGFARGGIFGRGLGESIEKLAYLPQKHTEFLLPVIGEEIGLIGTLGVVALLFLFFLVGYLIVHSSNDFFYILLGGGVLATLTLQIFLNISTVTQVLPVVGMPLPFFSYGGTFTIATYASVGILVSIARSTYTA